MLWKFQNILAKCSSLNNDNGPVSAGHFLHKGGEFMRKVVGIENELRADVGNSKSQKRFEDFDIPALIVGKAAYVQEAILNPQDDDPDSFTCKKINESVKMHESKGDPRHRSVRSIVEEHINRDEEQDLEPEGLNTMYRRRFGLSGGYSRSGFRVYLDGTHPEICTPECLTPYDIVSWDKAGEIIIDKAREEAEKQIGNKITVYKNNSDGFGHSWGTHENYFVENILFDLLTKNYHLERPTLASEIWKTFIVTRFIYCGSGKVGAEHLCKPEARNKFLLSQRAEFFECDLGIQTTHHRPLINTRDEPYTSFEYENKGKRLHVIIGDANMSEVATYLKTGMAMLLLNALECRGGLFLGHKLPILVNPLSALGEISLDTGCKKELKVYHRGDIKFMTAIDIQGVFCEELRAINYINHQDAPWAQDVISLMEDVLFDLKEDPFNLVGVLDWPTKLALMEEFLDDNKLDWSRVKADSEVFSKMKGLDTAYHRLDDKGIYNQLLTQGMFRRITDSATVEGCCVNPPQNTRAKIRGEIIKANTGNIAYINWHYAELVNPRRMVFFSDPCEPEITKERSRK